MFFKRVIKTNNIEIKKLISSQPCSTNCYGINWIYNKNNKMIIYYESGEKGSRGSLQLLKSFFFGFIKTKNDITKIKGLIISGPIINGFMFFHILISVMLFDQQEIFTLLLFYIPISIWIFISEKKYRKEIANYLNNFI